MPADGVTAVQSSERTLWWREQAVSGEGQPGMFVHICSRDMAPVVKIT